MSWFNWFPWSSFSASSASPSAPSTANNRQSSIRTGAAVPTRAERQLCWTSRDLLFACLNAHAIVDAIGPPGSDAAEKACAPQLRAIDRDCAAEWVRYFKTWRVADIKKRERIAELERQGAVKMDVTTAFKK